MLIGFVYRGTTIEDVLSGQVTCGLKLGLLLIDVYGTDEVAPDTVAVARVLRILGALLVALGFQSVWSFMVLQFLSDTYILCHIRRYA